LGVIGNIKEWGSGMMTEKEFEQLSIIAQTNPQAVQLLQQQKAGADRARQMIETYKADLESRGKKKLQEIMSCAPRILQNGSDMEAVYHMRNAMDDVVEIYEDVNGIISDEEVA
jgi:hypothetical protein